MTDVTRVNPSSVSTINVPAAKADITSTPARAKGIAPQAPATGIANAAMRPAKMSDDASVSSANLGGALKGLTAAKAFGPGFKFVNMSEQQAVAASNEALNALRAQMAAKGIAPQAHGFAPQQAFVDDLGRTNVRMARLYQGVPVFGEQVISHANTEGKVVDFTGSTLPKVIDVDVKPSQSPESAMAAAAKEFGGKADKSVGPTLVLIKDDAGAYHLAHHVTLASYAAEKAPIKMHYFVDAHSGEVLPLSFNEHGGFIPDFRQGAGTKKVDTSGRAVAGGDIVEGTGASIYLGTVALSTVQENGKYVLRDPNAYGSETRDAKNGAGGAVAANVILTDDNNKWGEESDDKRVKAGIDAQFGAVQFLHYLKDVHGRDSLDGKGMKLLSNVHVRSNYVNAYWDGASMNYGDGDGKTAGPLVDKDVASHEPMHGVTEHSSGLVYRGESGALNEAGSDILGSAGFSWFLRGRKDNGIDTDFLIGEDCWTPATPGDALRYMNDPMKDKEARSGDMYSRDNYKTRYTGGGDNGGVHLNSGIANNFFYLMVMGGTNRTSGVKVQNPIGMEKALKIYWRAHTTYFTPSTTFAQARVAWEKAATDIFGADSAELKVVKAAASAVGIEAGKAEALVA